MFRVLKPFPMENHTDKTTEHQMHTKVTHGFVRATTDTTTRMALLFHSSIIPQFPRYKVLRVMQSFCIQPTLQSFQYHIMPIQDNSVILHRDHTAVAAVAPLRAPNYGELGTLEKMTILLFLRIIMSKK